MDNAKNINIIETSDPTLKIKSVVNVKHSEVEFPVKFHELKLNTDLNAPPSNWLYTQPCFGIPPHLHRSLDFSSFLMAHQFPDCIGEVDVVSDAENIKKLLKIPYNPKSHISMMIHRVGNTLLLDNFDIYKYLIRHSQQQDWQWLKKFFFEYVLQFYDDKEKVLARPRKSRTLIHSRSLLSKFLYHSISSQKTEDIIPQESKCPDYLKESTTNSISSPLPKQESLVDLVPEPKLKEQLPQITNESFSRNIVWNFENLKMLIGADLPIFGGGTHPCVSLRLKDMNEPITVLTGIDYWLDNLMSNVPEVVMCCHLDGIVQKYELIKTEDLPHLDNSEFSPKLVRDIAQNILSFLKSKATKEGHTYWLFKGKDDDVVKLYDLTTLCLDGEFVFHEEAGRGSCPTDDNPFTVPVAMLLYRVAKRMKTQDRYKKNATIRALLKESLKLLDNKKYSQIVSSAHYLLSDLYLPKDTDPINTKFHDESEEETESENDFQNGEDNIQSEQYTSPDVPEITVSSLCLPYKFHKVHSFRPPSLSKDVIDRCESSLFHIESALECLLAKIDEKTDTFQETENLNDEPKMATPSQPIPMPYEPLNVKNNSSNKPNNELEQSNNKASQNMEEFVNKLLNSQKFEANHLPKLSLDGNNPEFNKETKITQKSNKKSKTKQKKNSIGDKTHSSITKDTKIIAKSPEKNTFIADSPSFQNENKSVAWNNRLKILLLDKACLIYFIYAYKFEKLEKYGHALRYMKSCLHCQQALSSLLKDDGLSPCPISSQCFDLIGNIYYKMYKCWHKSTEYIQDFNDLSPKITITELVEQILPGQTCMWNVKVPCAPEEAILLSKNFIEKALVSTDKEMRPQLCRSLGEVCNEISTCYLKKGTEICQISKSEEAIKEAQLMLQKSASALELGIELFTEVKDYPNVALLRSNSGKLYRVFAAYCVPSDETFSLQQKKHIDQALLEYKIGIDILKSHKKEHEEIWNIIHYEYCSALFNIGCLIQDSPPRQYSYFDTIKDVNDYLSKALNICEMKTCESKYTPVYQYRISLIYKRMAALYEYAYRKNYGETKHMQRLCEKYYLLAIKSYFDIEENLSDIIDIHLAYIYFIEFNVKDMKNNKLKLKYTLEILKQFVNCKLTLEAIHHKIESQQNSQDKDVESQDSNNQESAKSEEEYLLRFEKIIQSTLLKLFSMAKTTKLPYESKVKELYGCSLRKDGTLISNHLCKLVSKVKQFLVQNKL